MPSVPEIQAASILPVWIDQGTKKLTPEAVSQALAYIRSYSGYQKAPFQYPDIETKLAALTEFRAYQVAAALIAIDKVGDKPARLQGKVLYGKRDNVGVLIEYILSVVYARIVQGGEFATGRNDSALLTCSTCGRYTGGAFCCGLQDERTITMCR